MKIEFDKTMKIGVAVSGGADSMVLLTLLNAQGANIVAVNIEHGIRGETSREDSRFVIDYCKKIGVECLPFEVDSPARAKSDGVSVESAARSLRYEIFDNLIANHTCDVVALAHHADDRLETVLMRLFRGTGVRGLRGIVDRLGYIHPLIDYGKDEILSYAKGNSIPFRTDETNAETVYNRNYLRNVVIPLIEERYPAVKYSVGRMSDGICELEDYLLSEVTPYEKKDGVCFLPLNTFDRHKAIAKKSVAECMRKGMGLLKDIETRHLEAVCALKDTLNGTVINLPFGVDAVKEYDRIAFYIRTERSDYCEAFEVGKNYEIGSYSYKILPNNVIEKGVTFDADKLSKGAVVRFRKEGDVFKRYGGGTKPLAEYLTDIRYPLRLRDTLPVIAYESTVYVVLGVEVSEEVKVDKRTVNMVKVYKEITSEDE